MAERREQKMRQPVFFLGHGSPMNAVAANDYTKRLEGMRELAPHPDAILVVSAHWLTKGTFVTAMGHPRTIHDFRGFPEELSRVRYPAPGHPGLARDIAKEILSPSIQLDEREWGLDHGTWSVLRHVYPEAAIPVLQLSIDLTRPPEFHYELGRRLAHLRERGVLVVGSGNIVHNLRRFSWNPDAKKEDWALEFDAWAKEKLLKRDDHALTHGFRASEAGKLSVPTPDHYYPLLYVLGAAEKSTPRFSVEEIQNGSIAMRSFSA